jgi:hypothetical protein
MIMRIPPFQMAMTRQAESVGRINRLDVLADEINGSEDLKDQLAARRRGVDFLGEIPEIDFTLVEVLHHSNEVAQAAGQPVDFPDDKRVIVLQHLEATEKGGALGGGSFSLVPKNFLAPGAFQSG